jgi:predicted ATPase
MGNNLHILTGTPGTGKTTLIKTFQGMGIKCVQEPARPILTKQLEIDGPDLPSKSPLRFVRAMLRQMEQDLREASATEQVVFFDRGIPDLVAYAIRFNVEHEEFEEVARVKKYNGRVFILPPWEEIFVNDELRKLPYEEALKFHNELVKSYQKLGYQLLEVPRLSVEKRAEFILGKV